MKKLTRNRFNIFANFNNPGKGRQEASSDIQDRYRSLVENLSVGIYRNTPGPKGHFLEANSAIVKMFEAKSKKEFMKHNVSDLYQNPKERKKFVEEILKKGELRNKELNLVTLKGKKIVASVTAVKKKDKNGKVYFDGIIEDITKRKKMENELLKSRDALEARVKKRTQELQEINKKLNREIAEREIAQKTLQLRNKELEDTKKAILNVMSDLRVINARNEAILNSMADGVIVIDKNGLITLMNHSAEKLLGHTIEESVGKKWFKILKRVDEEGNPISPQEGAFAGALVKGVTHIPTLPTSTYYVRKNKTRFSVARAVSPIRIDERIAGAVNVFRDVTFEKDLDKMKDEFMDIAAHDLRTPAAAIRGFISRVLDGDAGEISDKAKNLLSEAYEGNMRLINLVDDFLAVSRLERGKIKIKPKTGDLTEVVETALKGLSGIASSKGLTLTYKKIKLPAVLIDKERTIQVLNNLIGNAIKFTEKGGITISHKVDKDKVITNITDTGIGISPELQKHLFQKYSKKDNGAGRSGLGLGLYISKLCIEGSGGKIWAKSKEGKGSTFSFSLLIAK